MRAFLYGVALSRWHLRGKKEKRSQLCKHLRVEVQVKDSKSRCPEMVEIKRRKVLWARIWGKLYARGQRGIVALGRRGQRREPC